MEKMGEARRLALYDFDGTMLRGDSIGLFVRAMLRHRVMTLGDGLKALWATLLWKIKRLPVERVKQVTLSPLKRLPDERREEFLRDFVRDVIGPRLYPTAAEMVRRKASDGYLVMVVSASPTVYLRYISDLLPVDAVLGTDTDADFAIQENMTGEAKPRAVLNWLERNGIQADWAESVAYGDSESDLPMLRLAGTHRFVNAKPATAKANKAIPNLDWSF